MNSFLVGSNIDEDQIQKCYYQGLFLDEEGNEIDPREELVKHLLEYKKYKSVISQLVEMEADRIDREARGKLDVGD